MGIDVKTRKSPGWWMQTLAGQLHQRRFSPRWSRVRPNPDGIRPPLTLLNDYLRGEPPLTGDQQWAVATREFMRMSRMNYAQLAVGAVQDRGIPVGWRTAVDFDRDGDQIAQSIADENKFALRFGDTFGHMLGLGDGYMYLGPPAKGSKIPTITAEDPRDVITAHDPATGETLASLKVLRDDWDGADFAYLCLPGRVYTSWHVSAVSALGQAGYNLGNWDWHDTNSGRGSQTEVPQALPASLNGQIPMVRFPNRNGVGEFEPHLSVLDRINDGIFERVNISKMQAFKQRALTGLPDVYPEDHDLAGQQIEYPEDMFSADPGAVWRLPADTKIWESSPGDIAGLRMAIKDDVEMYATVTSTPLYMINPDAASGSAEGASTQREAHAFRVEDRLRRCDDGISSLMSMAFSWMGESERADRTKIRTIWGPTVRLSLEQKMSAASQAAGGGLPWASVMTDIMGYAPSDLPRLERERADDLLFAAQVADNGQ